MVFFANLAGFLGIFFEIQDGNLPVAPIGENFGDLNDILAIFWQFLAVYLVFFGCSLVFFLTFQGIFKAIFCLIFPI